MKSTRSNKNAPLSQKQIDAIITLRLNGCYYSQIAEILGIGKTTAQKYGKDVIPLPRHRQKNPFRNVKEQRSKVNIDVMMNKLPANMDEVTQRELRDKEYWRSNHVEGERYLGPIEMFSLNELKEMMEVPTGYISELCHSEWYDYYLSKQLLRGGTLSPGQIVVQDFIYNHSRAMAQMHREFGKTVLCIGGLAEKICHFPENNFFVQSEILSKSKRRVSAVRGILMTNPQLIADYGYLPRDKKYKGIKDTWKRGEFTVKRETIQTDPTLMALSWTDSEMLGGHFMGGIFDDPWSGKLERRGEKAREAWFEWHDTTFIGCLEDGAFVWFICTRKGIEDIYIILERTGQYKVLKIPAIYQYPSKYHFEDALNKHGMVYKKAIVETDDWFIADDSNGRFSIEYFLEKENSMVRGAASFAQEFQLEPVPKGGIALKWKSLNFISSPHDFFNLIQDEKHRSRKLKVEGAMDLAFGKSQRAAFTALCIIGYLYPNIYLLQSYLRRNAGISGKSDMINRAKEEFPMMNTVHVESDLQQTENVSEIQARVGVKLNPVQSRQEQAKITKGDYPESWTPKQCRIYEQLDDPWHGGNIWVNKNMRHYDEFEREARFFPKSPFIDLLDAFGIGISRFARKRAYVFGYSG